MAKKRAQGTLGKVGETVKDAAGTVAEKTGEYVVEPVGKALGLTETKKTAKKGAKGTAKKTTAKKAEEKKAPATKATAKKTTAKKPASKKGTTKAES
jgi:hypothetical protein